MISDILIPFLAIALGELGDKTQLSVLLLSTRTKKHFQLFLGVTLAFLLTDGAAVLAGSWIGTVVPAHLVKAFSGIIFIVFGILTVRSGQAGGETRGKSRNPFLSGFVLIFLTEWGDKTQIMAALFAAEYDPVLVLIGAMASLALLSLTAIYLGRMISEKLDQKTAARIAGTVFIVIGISFFAFLAF